MSDWPVGLSTGCFYQKSIFECLDAILAGGFSLLEICSSPSHLDYHDHPSMRELAKRLENQGIGAFSFHAPFADHIDISSTDIHQRCSSVREVIQAVEGAAILGTRYFVIHPGPEHSDRPVGEERRVRLENVAKSLSEIAAHCQQHGLTCVLENKLPHLIFGSTADMLWILGEMTVTDVGVCLDTGHAYLAGELDTAVAKLSRHLRMVHASDNNRTFDDHLPPGRGSIDWTNFLRQLRENRFGGSIIMEIAGRGTAEETLDGARRARQFLRQRSWSLR